MPAKSQGKSKPKAKPKAKSGGLQLKLRQVTGLSKRQTGKSNRKSDQKRLALIPGLRVSKTGRVYYERRRNRSDADPGRRL